MATTSTPEVGQLTSDLCKQIAALSRDGKEQLIIWLQEELDGGPFIGELPQKAAEAAEEVKKAWKDEIARRIEDMKNGRVEEIDAQGSAARLLRKMLSKHAP
jgi:hypothetical protein